jgi:hypothetical protein
MRNFSVTNYLQNNPPILMNRRMCRGFFASGAAQESNLPSRGLPDLTGFEASVCWAIGTGAVIGAGA